MIRTDRIRRAERRVLKAVLVDTKARKRELCWACGCWLGSDQSDHEPTCVVRALLLAMKGEK